MTARQPLVLSAAIGLALTLASAPAVQAQNLLDILRGYVNSHRHSGGRILPNSASVQYTVDSGISNYYNEISSGVASGRLTAGEEAALRHELNLLIAMRDRFMSDGGYSGAESNEMVAAFNRLNGMIAASLNNGNVAFGRPWGGGAYPTFDSVVSLQARVRARINRAAANGSISAAQTFQLRSEYQQIARQLNRRTMSGNLNAHPTVRRLIALDRRLSNAIAARGTRWF